MFDSKATTQNAINKEFMRNGKTNKQKTIALLSIFHTLNSSAMRKMKMFSILLALALPLSFLFAHNEPGGQKKTERPAPFLAQEAIDESWFQTQPANCHPAACNLQLAPGTEMSEAFIPVSKTAPNSSPVNPKKVREIPVFEDHTIDL